MPAKPYSNICAISKACQVLEPRWTLPILNVMWGGSTRFNEIRRAVGGVSPGTLSKRLAEMETAGLIQRVEDRAKGTVDYVRTDMAIDLEDVMHGLSRWAQRNIEAEVAARGNSVSDVMWYMQHQIRTDELPARRVVMRFHFSDEEEEAISVYWLVHDPGLELELCIDLPGVVEAPQFDVDLYIETSKLSLNSICMGRSTIAREVAEGRLYVSGDALLERSMERWMPRSIYADVPGVKQLRAAE